MKTTISGDVRGFWFTLLDTTSSQCNAAWSIMESIFLKIVHVYRFYFDQDVLKVVALR